MPYPSSQPQYSAIGTGSDPTVLPPTDVSEGRPRAPIRSLLSRHHPRLLLSVATAAGLLLLTVIVARYNNATHRRGTHKPKLFVDPTKGSFTILQITDLHLGEAEFSDWGPEQDRKTWLALDSAITSYPDVDLIILSGDQLTANNVDRNATAYYRQLGDFLSDYDKPWALLFGNHDDAQFEQRLNPKNDSDITRTPAKTSRRQLALVDQSYSNSLTEIGPSHLFGVSNYILPIYKSRESDELVAQVFMLDTGGGTLVPQLLTEPQVDWFRTQRDPHSAIPALVFQHIPMQQHLFQDEKCVGFNGDGGIDPVQTDGGMMQCLLEDDNVWWVAVGHNHGNDYCCRANSSSGGRSKLHLCFGRHSGYGGYGTWERGVRLYELDVDSMESMITGWRTWVRLESGEVVDRYDPKDVQ